MSTDALLWTAVLVSPVSLRDFSERPIAKWNTTLILFFYRKLYLFKSGE